MTTPAPRSPWARAGLHQPGRVRGLPRHDDPVRRLPVDQRRLLDGQHRRRCRGCSTPTPSCSPRSSSRPGDWPTGSGGAGRSWPPWCCSRWPRCCAAWRRRRGCWSPPASCRPSARPPGAVVAGPGAADLPPLEDPGRRRHLGRRRCRRRCGRADARRPRGRAPRLALGLLHQPARRDRQLLPRAAGSCPRGARPTPAGCPIRSAWCCWPSGWPSPPSASCRPTTGAGRAPRSSPSMLGAAVARRRCSCGAAASCPNPLLDLTLFESPSFRWANAGTARLLDRVHRHVPRQRAVPHPGVGLLDPARPASPSRSAR